MNTKIVYNAKIKVAVPNTAVNFTTCVKLSEEGYITVLKGLEEDFYITVMNESQDLVTINTQHIYSIETKIDIESDINLDEEEEGEGE